MRLSVRWFLSLSLVLVLTAACLAPAAAEEAPVRVLVQGHASLRITTGEGKVIYIDPYAGEGYDVPADLILLTHSHPDHTKTDLIRTRNEDCRMIRWMDALKKGVYHTFDLGWVTVEATEAGNNPNHNIKSCVGFILTFTDGKTLYVSGDTSTTAQMATLAERHLDYAFFCCDGTFNMGPEEAIACAETVGARISIPYHPTADDAFTEKYGAMLPESFRLIPAGEEFVLE